jgi:hypothetical protein
VPIKQKGGVRSQIPFKSSLIAGSFACTACIAGTFSTKNGANDHVEIPMLPSVPAHLMRPLKICLSMVNKSIRGANHDRECIKMECFRYDAYRC